MNQTKQFCYQHDDECPNSSACKGGGGGKKRGMPTTENGSAKSATCRDWNSLKPLGTTLSGCQHFS